MNFHFIYRYHMRIICPFLPSLLLLASTTIGHAQTVPPAAPTTLPATTTAALDLPAEAPTHPLLLKVGLNAGRALQWGGYHGLLSQVPVSVGAEYSLNSKFTLYSQLDADVGLPRRYSFSGDRSNLITSGAVGLGGRYYYNQAGRARHNRPHGPFIGNYLGLEAHVEMRRYYGPQFDFAPAFNAVWGMQRRLNRNFLFDFNAGVGLGPTRNYISGFTPSHTTITTQFNLSLYFGR
jgi:hypothetical protein